MRFFALFTGIALAGGLHAASVPCQAPEGVQALSPWQRDGASLAKAEREAKVAGVRRALSKTPDDLFLNRWLIALQAEPLTGSLAAEYRAKLDKRPGDLNAAYLYADALIGKDTPAAVESLQKIIARGLAFPWAYLSLVEIYVSPAFHDERKLAENVRAYHGACPMNPDAFEHLNAITDDAALGPLAGELRALLRKDSKPPDARYWSLLWAAEFRLAQPEERELARKSVAEDLKALEVFAPANQPAVANVLSEGYRLTGDTVAVKRMDRILAAARPADPAFEAYEAWEKAHPRGNRAEATARDQALYQVSGEWIKQWPDHPFVWQERREALVATGSSSSQDWKQVADGLLRAEPESEGRKAGIAYDWMAAGVMLPEALNLIRDVLDWSETSAPAPSDLIRGTVAAQQGPRLRSATRFSALLTLAQAAIKLKDFDLANSTLGRLREWLDTDFKKYDDQDPANFPDHEGKYLTLMAQLAEAQGQKLDALASYGQLITNPWYMREYGGAVKPAEALFKELGGSGKGWAAWSKVQAWPAGRPEPPRGWPTRAWNAFDLPLPEMHVPDTAGRQWTLADFKGKTTFVFPWATWCGPCWRELPAMQELYDTVKDRRDVQAISLSMDENPGIVQKFMEERKFNFPVLVSREYVEPVLADGPVGQIWIVDEKGRIRLRLDSPPPMEQVWLDVALDKLNHPPHQGLSPPGITP